jgi:hypothetical protein
MKRNKKTPTLHDALVKFWEDNGLPGGPQIEHDNEGQIVIYTGMKWDVKKNKFVQS